jgi:hypothetical protein
MAGSGNRIYGFYNKSCGLGPEYFGDYLNGKVCPSKKMTLYYRLTVSNTNSSPNRSVTNFVTDPVIDTYRGIGNRYMVDSDFLTYNQNIITFVSMRTPANPPVFDKNMYNETVCINVGSSFIQAVANYVDNNNTFETLIPYVEYAITAKTGIFTDFNKLVINFYNDTYPLKGFEGYGPIRTVNLS